MSETARPSEGDQKVKVLEIGCGDFPAVEYGGTLFKNNSVDYVAVDIPSHYLPLERGYPDRHPLALANAAQLPFRDDSFDYILMRNVFGQFRVPKPLSDIDDLRMWGMYEAFRTLKPGGKIAIAEENTPWQEAYVRNYLLDAGFEKVHIARSLIPYQETNSNTHYRKTRRKFYNDGPLNSGFSDWYGYPYIMTAQKPTHPRYINVNAEMYKDQNRPIPVFTRPAGLNFYGKEKAKALVTVIYKKGKPQSR